MVDNTIRLIREVIAKQTNWNEIVDMTRCLNYTDKGQTYAIVKDLKLNVNHITVELL